MDKLAPAIPKERDVVPVRPFPQRRGAREDGRTQNEGRKAYFTRRRLKMRLRGLKTVATYHNRPVECFRCGKSMQEAGVLELDHVYYTNESEKRGHSAERAEEAIKFPSRFILTCRPCHIKYDLQNSIGPSGMHADANLGSEVRALEALKNRKEAKEIERAKASSDLEKAGVILARLTKERDEWRQLARDALAELERTEGA